MSVPDLKTIPKEDILGFECKHATYTRSTMNDDDLLTIKEVVHLKNGTKIPNIRRIKNFKRQFWITKKPYQNHEDKKEWEYTDKLREFECTQAQLNQSITRAIGYGNPNQQLKVIARNQYIYGADITTPTLIKRKYQQTWAGLFTPNQVAVLDTETDMWHGDGLDPIIATLTFKDRVLITIREDWIAGIADVEDSLDAALQKHLGKFINDRRIKIEIQIHKRMGDMIAALIRAAHVWQPDFITFWNMDFDMRVMIQALERDGYDLAELFSDPSVPPEFRHFRYKRGPSIKVKADGTSETLAWYDQWHVVECPAGFVFIDAACVYRNIRRAKGKEASYSLDYTLKKNLGDTLGKLYFELDSQAEPGSIEWHMQMQRDYKINYLVYNVFDCLGVELLDEKTRDLNTQISILSNSSEYTVFNSNPKRNSDELHFFCLGIGKVVGTVSDKMEHELDRLLLGKDEWIVTLPTHNVINNGVYMIEELPSIRSLIRKYVSDADIESTYPNGEIIMNLSKETTVMELARIRGILPSRQRLVGINLTGGPSNAIEIGMEVLGAPSPWALLEAFEAGRPAQPVATVDEPVAVAV